jgi:hypothetical protein
MNLLTVVSPLRNYRAKLLELMSLTSVSITLALGIVDEPDSSTELNAVSTLSVLIIVVNVVFVLCVLYEILAEFRKMIRKQLRTKHLWEMCRQRKDDVLRCMLQGMPNETSFGGSDGITDSFGMTGQDVEASHDLTGHGIGASFLFRQEEDMGSDNLLDERGNEEGIDIQPLPERCAQKGVLKSKWKRAGTTALQSGAKPDFNAAKLLVEQLDQLIDDAPTFEEDRDYQSTQNSETVQTLPEGAVTDSKVRRPTGESAAESAVPLQSEHDDSDFFEDLEEAPLPPAQPGALASPLGHGLQRRQFSVAITDEGHEYFIDERSNETMWTLPEDGEVVDI